MLSGSSTRWFSSTLSVCKFPNAPAKHKTLWLRVNWDFPQSSFLKATNSGSRSHIQHSTILFSAKLSSFCIHFFDYQLIKSKGKKAGKILKLRLQSATILFRHRVTSEKKTIHTPPPSTLHSKLGCFLFSTDSSISSTTLDGGDGGTFAVSKTSERPFCHQLQSPFATLQIEKNLNYKLTNYTHQCCPVVQATDCWTSKGL